MRRLRREARACGGAGAPDGVGGRGDARPEGRRRDAGDPARAAAERAAGFHLRVSTRWATERAAGPRGDNELPSVPAAAPSHFGPGGRDALLSCRGTALLDPLGRSRDRQCPPHRSPAGLPGAGPTRDVPHPPATARTPDRSARALASFSSLLCLCPALTP